MVDPGPSSSPSRWLWPLLIALLLILLLIWMLSPSGNRDGQVQDPIVTPDLSQPAAPGPNEIDLEADAAAEAAAGRAAPGQAPATTATATPPAP